MKKNRLALIAISLVMSLTGCSSVDNPLKNSANSGNGGGFDTGDAELDKALANVDNYDPTNFVKLGKYKGVEVDISSTQDDIDSAIMDLLSENTSVKQIKKGKVKEGDTVNIDFVGKLNNKEFEGGSAQGFSLEIGSHSFIDGFEEGLIGLSVGDTTTLDLKFPDPYPNNPDYAGRDVQFDVTINYINGKTIVPEYNDEFINTLTNGEYTSADEYTENVLKADIVAGKKESVGDIAYEKVLNTSTATETPDYLVTLMKMRIDASYRSMAEANGYSDFNKFLSENWQMSEEQYNEQIDTTAVSYVGQKLIAEAIASKENIEVTDEDYNKYLEKFKNNLGDTKFNSDEELEQYVVKTYKSRIEDLIHEAIISEKVIAFVKDNAVEVDGTSNEEEPANE